MGGGVELERVASVVMPGYFPGCSQCGAVGLLVAGGSGGVPLLRDHY